MDTCMDKHIICTHYAQCIQDNDSQNNNNDGIEIIVYKFALDLIAHFGVSAHKLNIVLTPRTLIAPLSTL